VTYAHIVHKKTGAIGVADIPDWLNFDEQPPRSFGVKWVYPAPVYNSATTTEHTVRITKEVADIMIGV
jgi:hypothetical protein